MSRDSRGWRRQAANREDSNSIHQIIEQCLRSYVGSTCNSVTLFTVERGTVWLDVRIKTSPYFSQSCPKSINSRFCSKRLKFSKYTRIVAKNLCKLHPSGRKLENFHNLGGKLQSLFVQYYESHNLKIRKVLWYRPPGRSGGLVVSAIDSELRSREVESQRPKIN